MILRCRHLHISWPQAPRDGRGPVTVQCHDCFRRLEYDMREMRIVEPQPRPPAGAQAAEGERA